MTAKRQLELSFDSWGNRCAATLFLPDRNKNDGNPPPVIIMAHGFAAQRNFRLPAFAEQFTEAGFACFSFDYRTFGESDGKPRHWVSPHRHLQDWRHAIKCVQNLEEVSSRNIILWGTSYSGGQVLKLASEKPKIIGVIAQVPFVSGLGLLMRAPFGHAMRLTLAGLKDIFGTLIGRPHYAPVVGREHEFAAMNRPECWDGWNRIRPPNVTWDNRVLARAFLTLPLFNPSFSAHKISVPTLIVAGRRDSVTYWDLAKRVSDKIPNCEFKSLNTNHFEPYVDAGFEENIAAQLSFLKALPLAGAE